MNKKELKALTEVLVRTFQTLETLSKTQKALNFRKMRHLELAIKTMKTLSDGTKMDIELGQTLRNNYAYILRRLEACRKHRFDPTIVSEQAEKARLVFAEGIWKQNYTFYETLEE